MTHSRDRRRLDVILREPLTRLRVSLNMQIAAARGPHGDAAPFGLDALQEFAQEVLMVAQRGPHSEAITAEIGHIVHVLATGQLQHQPRFTTPEEQLLWGATLACLLLNPQIMQGWVPPVAEGELRSSQLWQDLTKNNRRVNEELRGYANIVSGVLRDRNVRYAWAEPGEGFTLRREKKIVAIDLMQSLIVGFEHSRADVCRQIGRSILLTAYPARMQEVYRELQPLRKKMEAAQKAKAQGKKGKGVPKLSKDEHLRMRLLSAEWELREMMFSAAEDNVTSRFVVNASQGSLQNFSVSLNNTAVTFRGMGLTRLPKKDEASEALRRYMNLCNTVRLSFYQNNGLFDDTDRGWRGVGVDAGWVRKLSTRTTSPSGDGQGTDHSDFRHLRDLCGGPEGLEHLQPKTRERLFVGIEGLRRRALPQAAKNRAGIVEEIWRLYAEDMIQEILKSLEENLQQEMDQKSQQQDDQDGQDNDDGGDGGEGSESDQEGPEGSEGQSSGQGEGQGQGKGKKGDKSDPAQKKKNNKKQQRDRTQGDQLDADEAMDEAAQDAADGQDGTDKEEDADGQGDDADDTDGQEKDGQEKNGQGKNSRDNELGRDGDNQVPVDGVGDMDAASADAMENPGDETDPDADADGADAEGQGNEAGDGDGDGALTEDEIDRILDEMSDAEESEQSAEAEADGDGDGPAQSKPGQKGEKSGKGKGAGKGKRRKLSELAQEDWTDYYKRVAELVGPITQVRKLFTELQALQVKRKLARSKTLGLVPEGGDVADRFNRDAQKNLGIKKASGQVTLDDFNRFQIDAEKRVPAQIDVFLMIDGSQSMEDNKVGSASVISLSVQAAAIIFEAATDKKLNIRVFVGIWGDDNPPILLRPGVDKATIGREMQKAKKGLRSGTKSAPMLKKTAEVAGTDSKDSDAISGFVHLMILSDGDIADKKEMVAAAEAMFASSDKVTVDVAILGKKDTAMEKAAREIKGKKPFQDVGVYVGLDPEVIPFGIVGALLSRMRKCGSFTAVPSTKKREAMRRARRKMGP